MRVKLGHKRLFTKIEVHVVKVATKQTQVHCDYSILVFIWEEFVMLEESRNVNMEVLVDAALSATATAEAA